jgi:hypothetical protein
MIGGAECSSETSLAGRLWKIAQSSRNDAGLVSLAGNQQPSSESKQDELFQ